MSRYLCLALLASLAAGQADEPDCTAVVCTTDLCWDGSNHTQINGKGECCQCPPRQDIQVDGDYKEEPDATRVVAMEGDDAAGVMFAATTTHVVKYDQQLQNIGMVDLASEDIKEIATLTLSSEWVFLTVKKSDASWYLAKLNKTDLSYVGTGEAITQGIPYALIATDTNVYCGHSSREGEQGGPVPAALVTKWSYELNNLESVELSSDNVGNRCSDVRKLEFSAKYDKEHVYANCFTSPGIVIKVELARLQVVGSLELKAGENKLLSGAEQDGDFIYVGTDTSPGRVVKIQKSDMSHKGAVELEHGEDVLAAMDSDYLSVYAATYTRTPKVVRINKETMQAEARVALDQQFTTGIAAITHVADRLYVGSDMTPPRFQRLSPGSFYVPRDCELSDWGDWSACDASVFGRACGRGVSGRTRTMVQDNTPGGEPCLKAGSHKSLLKEQKMCSMEDACEDPKHNCVISSGMTWSTAVVRKGGEASGSRPRCTDRDADFTVVEGLAECACPADKPLWMGNSKCANATQCDERLQQECTHLKCMFVAGHVKVSHHNNETNGGGFACRHTSGRTGECKCFCETKLSSPSEICSLQRDVHSQIDNARGMGGSLVARCQDQSVHE